MIKITYEYLILGDLMDEALLDLVLERLDTVPLAADAAALLLAACEDEASLTAQLGTAPMPVARDRDGGGKDAAEPAAPTFARSQSLDSAAWVRPRH